LAQSYDETQINKFINKFRHAIRTSAWVQIRSAICTPSIQYNYDYLTELKGRLQTAHEVARQKLILCKEKSKAQYDKGTEPFRLDVGQQVLLYDETVRRGRSN
jgi:hypothetical protein